MWFAEKNIIFVYLSKSILKIRSNYFTSDNDLAFQLITDGALYRQLIIYVQLSNV